MTAELAARQVQRPTPIHPWWHGAAIYQVYPRSFADSDDDGIGDLPGITRRLGYIAGLGVDAVWLSPFFTSPMRDFGYDVADYCGVDPLFGTLGDFEQLVRTAHGHGLKVIIDQVYSHSSDQHPWFQESRSSKSNSKGDWYVWADPKADGTPPNNWQSVFGGPAWTWDARRGQYYLHNFLPEQPDLNLHNLDVQDALLVVERFWLDLGVDGFRFDAINFAMHDPELRDNPPAPTGGKRTRPFDFQQHLYNQSHPAISGFIERLRSVIEEFGDCFGLAEVGGDRALQEMQEYTSGEGRFHSAYGFDFLYSRELTPSLVAEVASAWTDVPGSGWPTWAFENHDSPRAISRWLKSGDSADFARAKMLLLCSLRGSIILYQGEELGLPQVDVPFDRICDPEAIANWPQTLSRDGARTPMPWAAVEPNLGFSKGDPWLPVGEDHVDLAVDRQEGNPDSLLHFTRACLGLRERLPVLRHGSIGIVEAGERLLVFERSNGSQRLRCSFNLSPEPVDWTGAGQAVMVTGDIDGRSLGAWSAVIEELPL